MRQVFGTLEDGTEIEEVVLKKGALEAKVLTYGAVLRELKFNGQSVVLGYPDIEGYVGDPNYIGAVVGRCANRITDGKAVIDGKFHQLSKNKENKNHQHGGGRGFSKRVWSVEQSDKASVLLKLVSEAGDEGYPGTLTALVRYTLTGSGALRVKMTAETDQPTLVNLTQHSYFNLDGHPTIENHRLEIPADRYLPLNEELVPTGEIRNVAWTPYDFQDGGRIDPKMDYDINYCLSDEPREQVEFSAALEDAGGDRRMEVWTTEPGLQIYDANGLHSEMFGKKAGICLEAQRWPDAINKDWASTVILRPGETYSHVTEFRFS